MCGGTPNHHVDKGVDVGLSPRVRGNPADRGVCLSLARSIPACAGEPAEAARGVFGAKVYPRVCGGTQYMPWYSSTKAGLSPRVRGNPKTTRPRLFRNGSIPACAGEPQDD